MTVDIAHNFETVSEAMAKLERNVQASRQGIAQYLRLVVGSGLIRDSAMVRLMDLQHRQSILSYTMEGKNSGAIVVTLK